MIETKTARFAGVDVTDPMIPVPFKVREVILELPDTYSFILKPVDGDRFFGFEPGQFNMLYLFGVGEVPISISGDPETAGQMEAVGPKAVGIALFSYYVIGVELASVLLLVGLVGAYYLGARE